MIQKKHCCLFLFTVLCLCKLCMYVQYVSIIRYVSYCTVCDTYVSYCNCAVSRWFVLFASQLKLKPSPAWGKENAASSGSVCSHQECVFSLPLLLFLLLSFLEKLCCRCNHHDHHRFPPPHYYCRARLRTVPTNPSLW